MLSSALHDELGGNQMDGTEEVDGQRGKWCCTSVHSGGTVALAERTSVNVVWCARKQQPAAVLRCVRVSKKFGRSTNRVFGEHQISRHLVSKPNPTKFLSSCWLHLLKRQTFLAAERPGQGTERMRATWRTQRLQADVGRDGHRERWMITISNVRPQSSCCVS